jgi:hypothetical protein
VFCCPQTQKKVLFLFISFFAVREISSGGRAHRGSLELISIYKHTDVSLGLVRSASQLFYCRVR